MAATLPLTLASLAAAGLGLVAAARGRPVVGWRHLGVALAVAGAALAVALVLLVVTGASLFALVHLAYLGATVTIPVVGAGLVVLGLVRGSALAVRLLALGLLVPAAVGAYATHVEPYRLRVERVEVAVDPARRGDDPVTVAILADLQTNHVGPHEQRAVDEVLAAEPDIILVPGDLYQGTQAELDADLPEMRALLGRLHAPGGVYFVRGDADGGGADEIQGHADDILDGLDIRSLADEVVDVAVGDRVVRVGGRGWPTTRRRPTPSARTSTPSPTTDPSPCW